MHMTVSSRPLEGLQDTSLWNLCQRKERQELQMCLRHLNKGRIRLM